jgi:hypothetical protein
MRIRSLTLEHILFLSAFFLALAVRLFRLGAAPLTDSEARLALQALEIARGGQSFSAAVWGQPVYVLLTGLSFALFGATGFLARLLPALAGSLLVFLPLWLGFRLDESRRMRWGWLVLSFGLALDPGLVALSRTAGSLMPALAFGLLALVLFARRWMILAGIAAGLALLSGSALLYGAVTLTLGYGAYRLLEWVMQRLELGGAAERIILFDVPPVERPALRNGLLALAGTLLIAGTFFLRYPQGLSGLAEMLAGYLRGWTTASGIPALRLPAALLIYQPLVVLFALLAAWRGWWGLPNGGRAEHLAAALSLWVLVSLLAAMIYPGRQVGDAAWALVPLWALAALELSRHLPGVEERPIRWAALGLTALLAILTVVVWVNFLNIARYQANYGLYWIIIGGALLLGVISTLLVAAGWSAVSARLGLVWALCIILGVGMISSMWELAQLRPQAAQELWSTPPAVGQAELLVQSLTDLSRWSTGHDSEVEIVLLEDSPAMRWALRMFPNLRIANALAVTDSPPIVITTQAGQTPSLAQSYRGQDLVWRIFPGWQTALPPNFSAWLAFHLAPTAPEQIILWARADLFPGGMDALSSETQP